MYLRSGVGEDDDRLDIRKLGFYPVHKHVDKLRRCSRQSPIQGNRRHTYQIASRL